MVGRLKRVYEDIRGGGETGKGERECVECSKKAVAYAEGFAFSFMSPNSIRCDAQAPPVCFGGWKTLDG